MSEPEESKKEDQPNPEKPENSPKDDNQIKWNELTSDSDTDSDQSESEEDIQQHQQGKAKK